MSSVDVPRDELFFATEESDAQALYACQPPPVIAGPTSNGVRMP